MPKSNAQRQAAYRARRPEGEGERRLNTWLSSAADCALNRLAQHAGHSKREVLERLLLAADSAILQTLDLDTPEWDAYLLLHGNGPDKNVTQ